MSALIKSAMVGDRTASDQRDSRLRSLPSADGATAKRFVRTSTSWQIGAPLASQNILWRSFRHLPRAAVFYWGGGGGVICCLGHYRVEGGGACKSEAVHPHFNSDLIPFWSSTERHHASASAYEKECACPIRITLQEEVA